MSRSILAMVVALLSVTAGRAQDATALEQQVVTATQSPQVTIVHLWAAWCPNCKAELAGWAKFLGDHPEVNVIFVTVWKGKQGEGRDLLAQNGIGTQPNFRLLVHPNGSTQRGEKMTEFLGQRVTWIPTTWVYRSGVLRYALNYGELRFAMLQQLVADAQDKWEH